MFFAISIFSVLSGALTVGLVVSGEYHDYAVYSSIISMFFSLCLVVIKIFEKQFEREYVSAETIVPLESKIESQEKEIEQLKLMTSKMARLSSLGEVAGNMGHEMNNQLAVVEGWAEQLSDIKKHPHKFTEDFVEKAGSRVLKHAKKLAQLTGSIRNYVRDSKPEDMKPVEAKSIIEDVADLAGPKLKNSKAVLKCFYDEQGLDLVCNENELSQVLLNLVSNSIDAVGDTDSSWVQLRATKAGAGDILFSVTDSGNGIADDVVAKMMEPYFTTKESGKGTGIGLAISQEITEAHGGVLKYDSDFKHTRFTLCIPKRQKVSRSNKAS